MNILIIDDGSGVFETSASVSQSGKTFLRLGKESFFDNLALARYFSESGDNVLLIRAALSENSGGEIFEYREQDEIPQLFIKPARSKSHRKFRFRELFEFSLLLYENAPGIAGLFKPDAIISGSFLPFPIPAAAKMARLSSAVLITELWCVPEKLLSKLKIFLPLGFGNNILSFFISVAFRKSDAVLGFSPKTLSLYPEKKNLLGYVSPAPEAPKIHSKEAEDLYASLSAISGDGTFTIAYCGEIEKFRALDSLIAAVSGFDQKVELFIIGDGEYCAILKKAIRDGGIKNVTFCAGVPEKDIPYVLSAADSVFYSENSKISGICSESKEIFKALLSGKPVIAVSKNNREFLRKSGGAILITLEEREGIALAIMTLRSMSENDRLLLGRRGKEFAKFHSEKAFAENYRKLIDELYRQKENLRNDPCY